MTNQPLYHHCLSVVRTLAAERGWRLGRAGEEALAAAIAPFAAQLESADDSTIARVALNYYLDGPMVQQMLAPNAADATRLWEEWRGYMLALARARGLTPEAAEDLAQDAYLETRKALPAFRFGSRVKTYFAGIFLNCYRRRMRTTGRIRSREQTLTPVAREGEAEPAMELVDETASPEEQVIETTHRSQIGRLVAAEIRKIVTSEDFQILYWYYVERTFSVPGEEKEQRWTDRVIGERLGMPLNTVTSRRTRALKRLKQNDTLAAAFAEFEP